MVTSSLASTPSPLSPLVINFSGKDYDENKSVSPRCPHNIRSPHPGLSTLPFFGSFLRTVESCQSVCHNKNCEAFKAS